MRDLTITLVQIDQAWENKKQNIALINDLLSSDFKTDLILLPEMFNTAFSMNAIELSEDIENSESIQQLKNWARQKNAAIYTSLMIKEVDKFYNRGCFVYPDGEICYYDKRKLFTLGGEELVFTAGQKEQIVSYLGWRINLQICYDLRFSECVNNTIDEYGNSKFDLLLYVANWPEKRILHWETLLRARAIEHQCFVVGVNRIGKDGNGLQYSGQSMIIEYSGKSMLTLNQEYENVKSLSLSKRALCIYREELPFLRDKYLDKN